mgnify:CR=1 FL=1
MKFGDPPTNHIDFLNVFEIHISLSEDRVAGLSLRDAF